MVTRLTAVVSVLLLLSAARAELDDLIKFMNQLQGVVEGFALEVEEAYRDRCNATVLSNCAGSQYSSCKSALNVTQICPPWKNKPQLRTGKCGDGDTCNGIVDFESAAVRIPITEPDDENSTPRDTTVLETVCFGPLLDDGMKDRFQTTAELFKEVAGVSEAPFMYFGASDGAFRIYPARPSENCDFDPRERPWYVAASSTPKIVVVVVDVSGSPKPGDFDHVKETAGAFVEAMANADRVSVVFMGEIPMVAEVAKSEEREFVMDQATNKVQKALKKAINKQSQTSAPDAEGAFNLAFDLIETTIDANVVDCEVAVVLLTSDKNLPILPQPLILERKQQVESLTGRTVLFFGYSTGTTHNEDIRSLECSLGAVWSMLDASRADGIVRNIRLFHEAFAYGLGRSTTTDISTQSQTALATWSEPYKFVSGDIPGTTVASPVYDRSKSPPLFLGVVGIDMALKAFVEALGSDKPGDINRQINARQRRQCGMSFSPCDLEALRLRSRRLLGNFQDGISSVCRNNTEPTCEESDLPVLDRTACPSDTIFPSILWDNVDLANVDFLERTCCAVDTPNETERGNDTAVQCPNAPTSSPSVRVSSSLQPLPSSSASMRPSSTSQPTTDAPFVNLRDEEPTMVTTLDPTDLSTEKPTTHINEGPTENAFIEAREKSESNDNDKKLGRKGLFGIIGGVVGLAVVILVVFLLKKWRVLGRSKPPSYDWRSADTHEVEQ